MPFGLRNSAALFQKALDIIISEVKWTNALVYLDDVITYSRLVQDHLPHLDDVLKLLHHSGINPKFRQCSFFTDLVDYSGHTIRVGSLEVSKKILMAVKEAKEAGNQTPIRSFLGPPNVYRRFILNSATIAAPLNKKIQRGKPIRFGHL